jgi:SAM-dependent methyltransferase
VSSHPDLEPAAIAALRTDLGLPPRPRLEPRPATEPPPADRAKDFAKRALDRATTNAAAIRVLDVLATRVAGRLRAHRLTDADRLHADVALLGAQLQTLVPALRALQNLGAGAEIVAASADLQAHLRALDVNQELFKGELAELRAQLERLGQAIAPAAGLAGVPERFAELRERVNALDRRTRPPRPRPEPPRRRPEPEAPDPGRGPAPDRAEAGVAEEPAEAGVAEEPAGRFDYVGFEQRFRGDSAVVLAALAERYGDLLAEHAPVLDFGCGRGELVGLLRERGVEAYGVDTDAGMVEEARARGLPVEAGDGVAWLRSRPEASLGAIIAVHVVEHLPLEVLVELLELAVSRLRPGGILVAETPNPASLIVLGNSYILDPTHVWPLHPSLLTFLCERAGFRSVQQRYFAPAEAYHLPRIDTADPDVPGWAATVNDAFTRLDDTLFGPQEYAVVATTPDRAVNASG